MCAVRLAVAASLALTAFTSSALADSLDPTLKLTAAGMASARDALLTKTHLGPNWTPQPSSASRPSPSAISCPALQPDQSGLVETGLASASFDDGPWRNITETVRVFRTTADAALSWARTDNHKLVACAEQSLEQHGEHLNRVRRLRFDNGTRRTAGYRIVTTMSRPPMIGRGPRLELRVYSDLLLLASGRTQQLVVFSTLESPLNRAFEDRVARVLAERSHRIALA